MNGCQWNKKKFTVPMSAGKEPDKCERCKTPKKKCDECQQYSEFVDRGFAIKMR
jgi:hypothetical protein